MGSGTTLKKKKTAPASTHKLLKLTMVRWMKTKMSTPIQPRALGLTCKGRSQVNRGFKRNTNVLESLSSWPQRERNGLLMMCRDTALIPVKTLTVCGQ